MILTLKNCYRLDNFESSSGEKIDNKASDKITKIILDEMKA